MDTGPIKNSALSLAQKVARVSTAELATAQMSQSSGASGRDAAVREISRAEVEDAVAAIQEFAQSVRRNVHFSLDDASERVVVRVTDGVSGDVIRQMPSEEALKLAQNLSEVRSLLFKAEA